MNRPSKNRCDGMPFSGITLDRVEWIIHSMRQSYSSEISSILV
jgi:hypothetical protein